MLDISKKTNMKMSAVVILIAALFVFSSLIVLSVPSSTAAGATLKLRPHNGNVGRTVKVTGLLFTPGSKVTISMGGTTVGSTTANSSGVFVTTFVVPTLPCIHNGCTQTVTATDGTNTATFTFTITPNIIIRPAKGSAGSSVTITGAGFVSGSSLTAKFNNAALPLTTNTDSLGTFNSSFTVPSGTALGNYTVTVTDRTGNTASATFTVT